MLVPKFSGFYFDLVYIFERQSVVAHFFYQTRKPGNELDLPGLRQTHFEIVHGSYNHGKQGRSKQL